MPQDPHALMQQEQQQQQQQEQEEEEHHCQVGDTEVVLDVATSGADLLHGQPTLRVWGQAADGSGERLLWRFLSTHIDWNVMASSYRFPRGPIEAGQGHVHVPFVKIVHPGFEGLGLPLYFTCGATHIIHRNVATRTYEIVCTHPGSDEPASVVGAS